MRPNIGCSKPGCVLSAIILCLSWTGQCLPQQPGTTVEIPQAFKVDKEAAARLRPQLVSQSTGATSRYATGRLVFEKLLSQAHVQGGQPAWELRIANESLLNAYSSPDGTIYVSRGLAQLAGPSPGLWAAILSHEIAHVLRRDWARRYLFEKSLQGDGGALELGSPGLPAASWTDPRKASEEMAGFCRRLELDADLDGLMMMARAGYHPDFVPALHHLLHARSTGDDSASPYAMHPCWETRDRQLGRAYTAASIEFDRLWPERFASPGGNPPTVVFAEEPTIRKTSSKDWEIQVPLRCQNLVGAIEVVLRTRAGNAQESSSSSPENRQLTGCTSPRTTITFTLTEGLLPGKKGESPADVYILDGQGSVLTRADVPRVHR